jgi:hypothetical protein
MRLIPAVFGLAVLGLLLGAAASQRLTPAVTADNGGAKFSATLTGVAEVPGPGDPDGTGSAALRANPGQGEICYTLTVQGIAPATFAHIHVGPAGVRGPVVVTLVPPTSGSSSACASVSRELALAILQSPERYYVNVHNVAFPDGAVRGQLTK